MKNFQQNLLIMLALALCGLCAWQWYFQTNLRQAINQRDDTVLKLSIDIQGYTNSIKSMDSEINGLQGRVAELKVQSSSNSQRLILQERDVIRLRSLADAESNEIVEYQQVTNELTSHILAAYDGVKKQNIAIKELVSQRDEFVRKYNDSIKARNELTDKYNALVERINKMQAPPAR